MQTRSETKEDKGITLHRVITLLDRQQLEFLDKLGKDSLFSTGHKLSYSEILRGLIELAMDMKVSGENVDSLTKLKERILEKCLRLLIENSLKDKPANAATEPNKQLRI